MNKIKLILIIISAINLVGCENKQSIDDFITVDVTKNYFKKEFILQDLFDIEYLPLETTDSFVTTASLQAIDEDVIVMKDVGRVRSGNIYIVDRNGKSLRTINRLGQGGEEYTHLRLVIYDKENQELYVNDTMVRKIMVYDLNGHFKRSFNAEQGLIYQWLNDFNRDYLICHSEPLADPDDNTFNEDVKNSGFMLVSKQDGNTRKIQIPYEVLKPSTIILDTPEGKRYSSFMNNPIIPYHDSWLLTEISSDTIYRYSQDHTKIPFITRTPSIQSMQPEIYLFPGVITDRYYFMQTVKMEFDFEKREGFATTDLVYDKQENSISRYVIYNGDFTDERPLNLVCQVPIVPTILNKDGIAYITRLDAHDLVESYEDGKLKGKLKEIAAGLGEESNPVIMIAKYKK